MAIGPTSLRRQEIKKYDITFDVPAAELENFLTSIDKKVFNLVTQETLLGAIKVDTVLDGIQDYKKEDSHIFVKLSTLLLIKERLIDAFSSEATKLLVIECDHTNGDVEELYNKLSTIVQDRKKVILITQKDGSLANKFKQDLDRQYEKKFDNFENLSLESVGKLLDKDIIFHGKSKKLKDLVYDGQLLKTIVGPSELVEIITSDKVEIGTAYEFLHVPNENLDRKLKLNKVSLEVLGEDEDAFILECEKAKEYAHFLQKKLRKKYSNNQIFVLDAISAQGSFRN